MAANLWPTSSANSSQPIGLDEEIETIRDRSFVVRFSSSSSNDSPEAEPDPFANIEVDQRMLLDSLSPVDTAESGIKPSYLDFSISGMSPSTFCEDILTQMSSRDGSDTLAIRIPRPPKSTRKQPNQFFLAFHRETVSYAHYFLFHDHQQLCNKSLYMVSEQFNPLRHAMVAFSALIYSMQINPSARTQAFLYYAVTLQELQKVLDRLPDSVAEYQGILATALQLSTFDVDFRRLPC